MRRLAGGVHVWRVVIVKVHKMGKIVTWSLALFSFPRLGLRVVIEPPEVHPSEGCGASIEEGEDECQRCGRCANRRLWQGGPGSQRGITCWVPGVTSRRAGFEVVLAEACWRMDGGPRDSDGWMSSRMNWISEMLPTGYGNRWARVRKC